MVESKKRIVGIVSARRVVAYVGHAGGLDSSVSYLGTKTALGGFTRLCVAAKHLLAKITTGEVIKQEKVVKKGSCGGVVRNWKSTRLENARR